MEILSATAEGEIAACYPVLKILRPHLIEEEFVSRIRRQQAAGYCLVYVKDAGCVVAATGYRLLEFLAWGRVLYVDDLVTDPTKRGAGHGGALLDWLIAQAKQTGCDELHLDSGYQRQDAHRLYLNKGLQLGCHHFSMSLRKT